MKVLWFTNTPCNASKKISPNVVVGGWLTALENEIKKCKDIELHICFYHNKNIDFFTYEGIHYYPIYHNNNSSKVNILLNRYRNFILGSPKENLTPLAKIVNLIKPDIIHYHGTEFNYGLLQAQVQNYSSVISIQGLLNPCKEKFFSGIPREIQSKYETILNKLVLNTANVTFKNFKYWAEREKHILSISKHIIGRTEWDKHISMLLAPQAQYYHGNEILRNEFYLHTWNKKEFNKQFTIISTITNGSYKGLETVLKTANLLKEYRFNFKWIIVGQDSNSTYAEIVEKWLKTKYEDNNVLFVGKKGANELISLLLNADVFCQVSHIENSPNSLCEAMILGLPIVATLAGGTDSLLKHKTEGYILQEGDPYSLAGTILDISHNFEVAKDWGIKAHETAIKRHNPEKVVKEYIKIYQSILSCH